MRGIGSGKRRILFTGQRSRGTGSGSSMGISICLRLMGMTGEFDGQ